MAKHNFRIGVCGHNSLIGTIAAMTRDHERCLDNSEIEFTIGYLPNGVNLDEELAKTRLHFEHRNIAIFIGTVERVDRPAAWTGGATC